MLVVVRDTTRVSQTSRPSPTTWQEVSRRNQSSVYWLGVRCSSDNSELSSLKLMGTGFAINGFSIATNYHVGLVLGEGVKASYEGWKCEPVAIPSGGSWARDHIVLNHGDGGIYGF